MAETVKVALSPIHWLVAEGCDDIVGEVFTVNHTVSVFILPNALLKIHEYHPVSAKVIEAFV